MTSKNEQAVRASHQGFNDRDWDSMASLVADDCVFVDGQGNAHKGPAAFANDYSKGWADALSDGKGLGKIDPTLAPVSTAVGVLGMPGMTAYTGLLDIGKPQAGETVVVAAASADEGQLDAARTGFLRGFCTVRASSGGTHATDTVCWHNGTRVGRGHERGRQQD